jgi:hypothetical protein
MKRQGANAVPIHIRPDLSGTAHLQWPERRLTMAAGRIT